MTYGRNSAGFREDLIQGRPSGPDSIIHSFIPSLPPSLIHSVNALDQL